MADKYWKQCLHPRTPENTWYVGKAGERCRRCLADYQRDYRARQSRQRVEFLRPREPLDLSGDPAVQLYRLERDRRKGQLAPSLAEAKAEMQRIQSLAEQQRKGGRPKGSKGKPDGTFTVAQRSTFNAPIMKADAVDALWRSLAPFTGR